MPRTRLIAFSCFAGAFIACSSPRPDAAVANDSQPTASPGARIALVGTDTAVDPEVLRLEREATALARTEGCSSAQQCRSAAMGSRPCGGPRYYLPYCPLTTDTTALFAKLAEVARAEDAYNRRNMLASTCEMRMAPDLELAGGACRATAAIR